MGTEFGNIEKIFCYDENGNMIKLNDITSSQMSFSSDGTSAYGRRGNELLDVLNGSSYSITFTCNCKDFDVLLGQAITQPAFPEEKGDRYFSERDVRFREKLDF